MKGFLSIKIDGINAEGSSNTSILHIINKKIYISRLKIARNKTILGSFIILEIENFGRVRGILGALIGPLLGKYLNFVFLDKLYNDNYDNYIISLTIT